MVRKVEKMPVYGWFEDVPNNADFFSEQNNKFYAFVLDNFPYTTKKPIVFLPCSKTKPYSKSLTHSYMSAITRNPYFEKVVISEPLAVVPYRFEKMAPKYDYPPEALNERDAMTLRQRLAMFLHILAERNPDLKKIYYIGGKHHYGFLKSACYDFELIACIPPRGIRDYAKCAKSFARRIMKDYNLDQFL